MLRTMTSLQGNRLLASDGPFGKVNGFYFDDDRWTVRYLVADTGTWLPGRLVLIAPQALGRPEGASRELPVLLSRQQIQDSPSIRTDAPVSRRYETDLHVHFGWAPYWTTDLPPADLGPARSPMGGQKAVEQQSAAATATATRPDPHLRSSREVIGYHIRATDDAIGHVEDFIVDCDGWVIRYMVVDTRNWLPGRKVLVSPAWITGVDWVDRVVSVDLDREQVKDSPEFDPELPVNREYEQHLYDYYGRPCYW